MSSSFLAIDSPLTDWIHRGVSPVQRAGGDGLAEEWDNALAADRLATAVLENWPPGATGVRLSAAVDQPNTTRVFLKFEILWTDRDDLTPDDITTATTRLNRQINAALTASPESALVNVGKGLALTWSEFFNRAKWSRWPAESRPPALRAFLLEQCLGPPSNPLPRSRF